jgi:hypothetical protein
MRFYKGSLGLGTLKGSLGLGTLTTLTPRCTGTLRPCKVRDT